MTRGKNTRIAVVLTLCLGLAQSGKAQPGEGQTAVVKSWLDKYEEYSDHEGVPFRMFLEISGLGREGGEADYRAKRAARLKQIVTGYPKSLVAPFCQYLYARTPEAPEEREREFRRLLSEYADARFPAFEEELYKGIGINPELDHYATSKLEKMEPYVMLEIAHGYFSGDGDESISRMQKAARICEKILVAGYGRKFEAAAYYKLLLIYSNPLIGKPEKRAATVRALLQGPFQGKSEVSCSGQHVCLRAEALLARAEMSVVAARYEDAMAACVEVLNDYPDGPWMVFAGPPDYYVKRVAGFVEGLYVGAKRRELYEWLLAQTAAKSVKDYLLFRLARCYWAARYTTVDTQGDYLRRTEELFNMIEVADDAMRWGGWWKYLTAEEEEEYEKMRECFSEMRRKRRAR